eukprot:gnl/TRDRNA2_/TRDRNA2_191408_c0_seq1.p1 gnl/TRDRNA2_/TRDRNA2_191408_c0~~gnl/TRDRNA2_/TRDRNA2_191408_c0_seq1.p1  ORF type:complete len:239 (-),score=41.67 gnl/TRDRNA2_/TRDRNA2_191408_c0_seq1:190-906(-)
MGQQAGCATKTSCATLVVDRSCLERSDVGDRSIFADRLQLGVSDRSIFADRLQLGEAQSSGKCLCAGQCAPGGSSRPRGLCMPEADWEAVLACTSSCTSCGGACNGCSDPAVKAMDIHSEQWAYAATPHHADKLALRLADDNPDIRAHAAEALGLMREEAAAHGAELAARLTDSDANVRKAAAWALGELGWRSSRWTEDLAKLLHDSNTDVQRQALEALAQIEIEVERRKSAMAAGGA